MTGRDFALITSNILYDLYGVFTAIRFDSSRFTPESVLALIEGLHQNLVLEDQNIVRQILREFSLSTVPSLYFIATDNVYPFIQRFRNEQLFIMLRDILFTMSMLIRNGSKEQIYDLADAVHNFPIIVQMHPVKSPQKLARKLLKPYRKKWKCELTSYTSEKISL